MWKSFSWRSQNVAKELHDVPLLFFFFLRTITTNLFISGVKNKRASMSWYFRDFCCKIRPLDWSLIYNFYYFILSSWDSLYFYELYQWLYFLKNNIQIKYFTSHGYKATLPCITEFKLNETVIQSPIPYTAVIILYIKVYFMKFSVVLLFNIEFTFHS